MSEIYLMSELRFCLMSILFLKACRFDSEFHHLHDLNNQYVAKFLIILFNSYHTITGRLQYFQMILPGI